MQGQAADRTLPVLYQDESLVIVDKPSGLLVHRGWANDRVVAMTLARDQLGRHVYPVHRLDRGTSGTLVFAFSSEIAALLCAQFEQGRVRKRYLALVRGIAPESATIDSPVPSSEDGPRVPALTETSRLFALERYSVVEARPRTGRLHQIRRHLKHIGHPIIGDVNYGRGELNRLFRAEYGLHRLALHAAAIELEHPVSGRSLSAVAPLPEDLRLPFERLGIPAGALSPQAPSGPTAA